MQGRGGNAVSAASCRDPGGPAPEPCERLDGVLCARSHVHRGHDGDGDDLLQPLHYVDDLFFAG
eukprot:2487495-Pyramimonas_sp.AAC.1